MEDKKPLILILCTGNSCRSQMAEYLLRDAIGDAADVASAGSAPSGRVHPQAVEVMAELGFNLEGARSKALDEFLDLPVETVITVCGNADQVCPTFCCQKRRYHWPFDDPPECGETPEETLAAFKRVRDEIRAVFKAYAAGRRDGLTAGA